MPDLLCGVGGPCRAPIRKSTPEMYVTLRVNGFGHRLLLDSRVTLLKAFL